VRKPGYYEKGKKAGKLFSCIADASVLQNGIVK
jgi:hypothetical protein